MDKKTIITRSVSVVAFVIILLLVLNRTYDIVKWKDTEGNYISTIKELYETPRNTMELVFVGSSHAYGGFDPNYFWTEYGIPAFNMCCSGQDKDSSYHQLKELLKTQKPKVVVVEAYGFLFEKQEHIGNAYRNMLSMDLSKNSNELIRKYVDKEEQEDYLLRWPIVHTRYRELTKYDYTDYEPGIYGRGFTYSFHIEPVGFDYNIFYNPEPTEISEHNKKWIDEMKELSKEYDFDLVFVEVPSDVTDEQQMILNGCEAYLTENDIPYLDLNKFMANVGIDPANDFIDFNHVNYGGAQKVTEYVAEYLLENYDFEPHDGEDKYELWDKNSDFGYHKVWAANLVTYEREEYLQKATTERDVITVLSLDGWFPLSETDWAQVLGPYNLKANPEELLEGGTWIFRDGKLIGGMSNEPDEPIFALDINKTDTLVIKNVEEDGRKRATIHINDELKCQNDDGLNVFVYDEVLGEVVSTRHYY